MNTPKNNVKTQLENAFFIRAKKKILVKTLRTKVQREIGAKASKV